MTAVNLVQIKPLLGGDFLHTLAHVQELVDGVVLVGGVLGHWRLVGHLDLVVTHF